METKLNKVDQIHRTLCRHQKIIKDKVKPDGSIFGRCLQCGDSSFRFRSVTPPNPDILMDGQIWVSETSVDECLVILAPDKFGWMVHFLDGLVVSLTEEEIRLNRRLLKVATGIVPSSYR